MPTRLEIRVRVERPEQVLTQDLHAHVCRWLDTDATHAANSKPFAISPLGPVVNGEPNESYFEVGLLDDSLLGHLRQRVRDDAGTTLRFGSQDGVVTGKTAPLTSWSWADAVAHTQGRDTRIWRLHVRTPCFFRNRNQALVVPRAGSILTGLDRRWRRWADVDLDGHAAGSKLAELELARASITGFDVATTTMKCHRRDRTGFAGWLELSCDRNASATKARRLDALIQLAAVAGVGSMTPFGFGVADVEVPEPV